MKVRREIDRILGALHHPSLDAIDLSLARIEQLLAALGNPETRLPPVIHVAGTNGKGSLIAYLQAICEAAGLRVHRYISPHLVRFNERIVLAGQEVDDDTLGGILREVEAAMPENPATFFEATTAAAFLAFAVHPADVLLLETGLGGRLDATNVVRQPLLTAITPISIDHAEYLGDTLEKIAFEKAGILKTGVSCVVGPQLPAAESVIKKTARERGVPLYRHGKEWRVEAGNYISSTLQLSFQPALAGAHQVYNAATAIACIEMLPRWGIRAHAIQQGIASATWPGRLQQLQGSALAAFLTEGSELWLDGGHNPSAGEVLAEWARAKQDLPFYLVCGMIRGKDTEGFLHPLAPYVQHLYAVPVTGEMQTQGAEAIVAAAKAVAISSQAAGSVEEALQRITGLAKAPCRVLICGSLYLAGAVLSLA